MPRSLSFREWLDETELTVTHIAALLEVSRSAIYQWRDGVTEPRLVHVRKLIDLSAGKLSAKSFSPATPKEAYESHSTAGHNDEGSPST